MRCRACLPASASSMEVVPQVTKMSSGRNRSRGCSRDRNRGRNRNGSRIRNRDRSRCRSRNGAAASVVATGPTAVSAAVSVAVSVAVTDASAATDAIAPADSAADTATDSVAVVATGARQAVAVHPAGRAASCRRLHPAFRKAVVSTLSGRAVDDQPVLHPPRKPHRDRFRVAGVDVE